MTTLTGQLPTIGRIVHYYAYGTPGGEYAAGIPRSAIITEVNNTEKGIISLCVLNPTGMFFNLNVEYSENPKGGYWGWPPRV